MFRWTVHWVNKSWGNKSPVPLHTNIINFCLPRTPSLLPSLAQVGTAIVDKIFGLFPGSSFDANCPALDSSLLCSACSQEPWQGNCQCKIKAVSSMDTFIARSLAELPPGFDPYGFFRIAAIAHFPDPNPKPVYAAHGRLSSAGPHHAAAFGQHIRWPAELF